MARGACGGRPGGAATRGRRDDLVRGAGGPRLAGLSTNGVSAGVPRVRGTVRSRTGPHADAGNGGYHGDRAQLDRCACVPRGHAAQHSGRGLRGRARLQRPELPDDGCGARHALRVPDIHGLAQARGVRRCHRGGADRGERHTRVPDGGNRALERHAVRDGLRSHRPGPRALPGGGPGSVLDRPALA